MAPRAAARTRGSVSPARSWASAADVPGGAGRRRPVAATAAARSTGSSGQGRAPVASRSAGSPGDGPRDAGGSEPLEVVMGDRSPPFLR